MAGPKKAATRKVAKKKAAAPAAKKKAAAPAAAAKRHPFDERKPDAPVSTATTHARNLAKQVRADAIQLALALVTTADATRLEALASDADAAQEAWRNAKDATGEGAVATARTPLREGRDQIYAALRTFADENEKTQSTLDDIGDVTSDDDLVDDTTRLLSLVNKHRKDLDGTDVTTARVAEVRKALEDFKHARGGEREGDEDGAKTTKQSETESLRKLRRARNRAFWTLATLSRRVCRRGQYAFRKDSEKRSTYTLYRRSTGGAAEEPVDPNGGGGNK